MTVRAYASPQAFKQALEQRLKTASNSGVDFARRRQLLVFDRFLARVVAVFGDTALLKGGLVLELRLERARATKDVDLRLIGSPESVLANLREAGRLDLMDFMTYEIAPDTEHPQIQNEGMRYEGLRFRAESRLAGKLYGQPFGVDVAFGDPILGEPETVTAEDILAFAGVPPPCSRRDAPGIRSATSGIDRRIRRGGAATLRKDGVGRRQSSSSLRQITDQPREGFSELLQDLGIGNRKLEIGAARFGIRLDPPSVGGGSSIAIAAGSRGGR
jgi:Nucleotidyl transferase AbiEii toxin, Type IV TA system